MERHLSHQRQYRRKMPLISPQWTTAHDTLYGQCGLFDQAPCVFQVQACPPGGRLPQGIAVEGGVLAAAVLAEQSVGLSDGCSAP
jgi:hypothetical protein